MSTSGYEIIEDSCNFHAIMVTFLGEEHRGKEEDDTWPT
jgi:hypothetical protein